jgi:hypothetical protein
VEEVKVLNWAVEPRKEVQNLKLLELVAHAVWPSEVI